MAICPFAVQQIIPESHTQGAIDPDTLIYHEAVSSADSLYGYWTTPGVELESHFYIGKTGTIFQFMDTNVRADANVQANGFAISVETWDDSNRDPLLAWNPAMLAAAKRLAAWCVDVHGIPARAPSTWDGGGIGGHNWFPTQWAGGARQCPGESRSAQIRNDIIPYVAGGGGWGQPQQEDDMQLTDRMKNAWGGTPTVEEVLRAIDLRAVSADDNTEEIKATQAAHTAALAAIASDRNITEARLTEIIGKAVKDNATTGNVNIDDLAAKLAAKMPPETSVQDLVNALMSVQGTTTFRQRPTGG